jgi:uncharacterized protein YggE
MNVRRLALLLPVAAAALLLSACSPSTTVASGDASTNTVNVSATGQADAAPDAAKASLTVTTEDPKDAQAAQASAASAATAVIAALKAQGVAEADIATQGVTVGPTYNYTSDGGQQLTGYQASQTFQVTLRDLTTAGATLDAVVAAGGNAARVDSVTPYVTDPSVAANKARAQAVEIAQKQAEQYASLLGFTLGPVTSVSESTSNVGPQPIAMAEMSDAAGKVATPIQAGTTQISVTVSISWSIGS